VPLWQAVQLKSDLSVKRERVAHEKRRNDDTSSLRRFSLRVNGGADFQSDDTHRMSSNPSSAPAASSLNSLYVLRIENNIHASFRIPDSRASFRLLELSPH
jgi:hypothetical protein